MADSQESCQPVACRRHTQLASPESVERHRRRSSRAASAASAASATMTMELKMRYRRRRRRRQLHPTEPVGGLAVDRLDFEEFLT